MGQSRVVSKLEIPELNDPFSDISPVHASPTSAQARVDPANIALPDSPSSDITSPVNPSDVALLDSTPTSPSVEDSPTSSPVSPNKSDYDTYFREP